MVEDEPQAPVAGRDLDDAELRGLGDGEITAGAQPGGDVGGELGEGFSDQGHLRSISGPHVRRLMSRVPPAQHTASPEDASPIGPRLVWGELARALFDAAGTKWPADPADASRPVDPLESARFSKLPTATRNTGSGCGKAGHARPLEEKWP